MALWHRDHDLQGVDAVVLPGGFSYGDYLRCGAISRFSPIMTEIVAGAGQGLPVLGICNGFQVLCESHLLPGALVRNERMKFVCRDQRLRIESATTPWTASFETGQEIVVPLKNGEGCFVASEDTLDRLEAEGRVVARYLDANPNGSMRDIAGCATSAATSSASCRTPSTRSRRASGPGSTASASSPCSRLSFAEVRFPHTTIRSTRSVPPPLLVVIHKDLSGARFTLRIRPNVPWK